MTSRSRLLSRLTLGSITAAIVIFAYDRYHVRHIQATEEITWTCTNNPSMWHRPTTVLLFERAPEHHIFEGDPQGSFCALVKGLGQQPITVTADIWGTKASGMIGWNELTIGGGPYPHAASFAGAGTEGVELHQQPFAEDFDLAIHRRSLSLH